jgi:type VI secretion system secreted protein VgrG
MLVDANTTWFTLKSQSGNFSVRSFIGTEEVNKPYEFAIDLISPSANEDTRALLGTEATLTIRDKSGTERHVHGLIRQMQQGASGNTFTHYTCWLVPRLWHLGQIVDHRIFQQLSVVEIIQRILTEQGFTNVAFNLFFTYEPREYCTQYGETDLDFITRLCEEEGIYFYFEHTKDSHTLCFCDREGGPEIIGNAQLRFFPGSGQHPDMAVISKLRLQVGVNSNAASYREWNFMKPKVFMGVGASEPTHAKAPVPDGMLLEQYKYPHLYDLPKPGERYVKLQLLRQLTFQRSIVCESDVAGFLPSYTFSVNYHPRGDVNVAWWVTSVTHSGDQPGVLEHEAPDGAVLAYTSTVTAIPEMTRYIPALEHPRPILDNAQTAIVTGPEGEEIYPDEYGRVKVQFFWDRADQWNENTTCWIRVSQGWAGSQYGTMVIPRIGHEVVVKFLEGNPDRPIITGRVYHDLNRPPYPLPENKTRTVFKSESTPGTPNEARGFNELRIEDKRTVEEIYGHAEKDVNIHVKNDWKEHILHDKHRTVDNFTYAETEKETHEIMRGKRKTELFANENLTVHGDKHFETDGKHLIYAGDEFHYEAGIKVVLEADAELTLKAGGSYLTFSNAGVFANGTMIRLNSGGSPGTGTGANPLVPTESIAPEVAPPPNVSCFKSVGIHRGGLCSVEE